MMAILPPSLTNCLSLTPRSCFLTVFFGGLDLLLFLESSLQNFSLLLLYSSSYSLSWLFPMNDLTLVTHLLTNPLFFPCSLDLSSLTSLRVIVDPEGDLLASPGLNITKLDLADSVPSAVLWEPLVLPLFGSLCMVIFT